MKNILLLLIFTSSIYAYEGCGVDKKDALMNLSGNIKSRINQNYTEEIKTTSNDDSVETKISSYINASTNLTLVNITYKEKKDKICANVEHEDQAKNTKKLLNKALSYKQANLPNNIDEKIKKLSLWLSDIKQLSFLIPVFLEDSQKEIEILAEKEKAFQDLYNDAIKESNSLVWRTCKSSKEEAKDALNKLLFVNKGKEEKTGFWASVTSVFKPSKNPDIDLFDEQVSFMKKDSKECAMIKKEDLLKVTISMNNEVKRFSKDSLDKNPRKRYKQIKELSKQFTLTKKLISLYPNKFKNADFANLSRAKEILTKAKETTYPQFVQFNIKSQTDVKIKLDKNFVKNNQKIWIKEGEHSYTIEAKDRCPIKGSFDISLEDEEKISEDFDDYKYPTVIFLTDKTPNIVVDGNIFAVNKKNYIKKCSDEPLRYLAKFSGQTRDGEIDINANAKNTIELKFLTSQELAIFNDAKTKNFKTQTAIKFSESLTPVFSKNLKFNVALGDGVSHGNLDLNDKGSFVYQSDDNYVGIDSFTYTIDANGEKSAPKVVNIRVEKSDAPVAIIPVVVPKDNNTTKEEPKVKEEKKKEEKKVEKKEETKEETVEEEKYQRFKKYVESQEQNIEKLKKLQKSYPDMFNRLLKEKTSGM